MVQAEHDFVVDSVVVSQDVLLIHRCMFGHLSLSCQRPTRRYRLDLVEEILKTNEKVERNSLNLNHMTSVEKQLSSPFDPISIHIGKQHIYNFFLDWKPFKSHISNAIWYVLLQKERLTHFSIPNSFF